MNLLGCLCSAANQHSALAAPQSSVQRIIANGHGYAVGGDVFFDVASLPGYGKLSGRSQVRCSGRHAWFVWNHQ